MNEWISNKGVCRTAPATPGLLNISAVQCCILQCIGTVQFSAVQYSAVLGCASITATTLLGSACFITRERVRRRRLGTQNWQYIDQCVVHCVFMHIKDYPAVRAVLKGLVSGLASKGSTLVEEVHLRQTNFFFSLWPLSTMKTTCQNC